MLQPGWDAEELVQRTHASLVSRASDEQGETMPSWLRVQWLMAVVTQSMGRLASTPPLRHTSLAGSTRLKPSQATKREFRSDA